MRTFPLYKIYWTAERIQAVLFCIILLYLIPSWVREPLTLAQFLTALVLGMGIDAIWNMYRYKRLVCCVSSAITVSVIQVVAGESIPFWGILVGVVIAIVIGKNIWGGTGKNIFNPAVFALFWLSIAFTFIPKVVPHTYFFILPWLLSTPFIVLRPFASLGLAAGMIVSIVSEGNLGFEAFQSYNLIFWSCIVITDPVTTTSKPIYSFFLTGAIGFFAVKNMMNINSFTLFIVSGILVFNLVSYIIEKINLKDIQDGLIFFKIKKVFKIKDYNKVFVDSSCDTRYLNEIKSVEELCCDEIYEKIRHSGVVGLGGAGYPTINKLKSIISCGEPEKYFIINGAECDPGLIHDFWLLRKYPKEILKGIKIICRCIDFSRVILATKETKGLDFSEDLEIFKLPDYYPVGSERILINEVIGKNIKYNSIPSECGVLVLNVQTILSIYEAVYLNRKAVVKFITIADMKTKESKVVKVNLGMNIISLAEEVFPGNSKVFTGGGIMQCREAFKDDVINNRTNFIALGEYPYYKESPLCLKCTLCKSKCPVGLDTYKIVKLVEQKNMKRLRSYNPEKCVECGTCSYFCLAGRNISDRVKAAKEYVGKDIQEDK